jgi:predicted transcriptional regulator
LIYFDLVWFILIDYWVLIGFGKMALNPATEIIGRSDSGTLYYADGHRRKQNLEDTLENISTLLENLHRDNSVENDAEYGRIQQNIKSMFHSVNSHQMDLLGDLTAVVESFKAGLMSPEQLEMMVRAEQDRSEMIMGLAGRVGEHLKDLFKMIDELIDSVEAGEAVAIEGLGGSMRSQMNLVFESVDSISRIMSTPPANLQQTMQDIEKDIEIAVQDVQRSKAAMSPLLIPKPDATPVPGQHMGIAPMSPGAAPMPSNKSTRSPAKYENFSRTTTEQRGAARFNSPSRESIRALQSSQRPTVRAYCVDNTCQTEISMENLGAL